MAGTSGDTGTNRQKIGRQIVLPFSRAFEIAWKGIRIRIWRSLITMSGIVLAIAFLMSVWTSGLFTRVLRDVSAEHELFPLVRGALEAEALQSGGPRIRCAVVEEESPTAAVGDITPGASIRRLLQAQGKFRADMVPADAGAVLGLLDPAEPTRPDILIFVGVPPVAGEPGVSEAIGQFVREGGFLLVYGAGGVQEAFQEMLPATPRAGTFTAGGDSVAPSDHLAARGVPWRLHPEAEFLETEAKADAVSLADSSGRGLVWLRSYGAGSVAWYPVTAQAAGVADVLSWFLSGRAVAMGGQGDPNSALLVKLLAHGVSEKLVGEEVDRRGVWLVGLSLMVCVVGITNAMLMSVTERFREIGTMKCLGALDKFVVKLFLIESSLQGVVGSLVGAVVGFLLAFIRALFTFHVRDLETGAGYWLAARFFPIGGLLKWFLVAMVVGIILSVFAAVYPALRAARMQPVEAMRAEA